MYDIESLTKINRRFVHAHFKITERDVGHINNLIGRIENSRCNFPTVGDVVRVTNKWGEYYPHAHIETSSENKLYICECPFIPFVYLDESHIWTTTSGGPWEYCNANDLVYVGKELKTFCDWGHCGPCADGAIEFQAEVNVWEYKCPNPLYGKYTTQNWDMRFVHWAKTPDRFGYRYSAAGIAFQTDTEYFAWLATYRGVEFEGSSGDGTQTYVVFTYRKDCHYLSRQDWDSLPFPTDTRWMNHSIIPIKYLIDDDNHIVHEYRYTNRVDSNDKTDIAYRVGYSKVKAGEFKRMVMDCGEKEK